MNEYTSQFPIFLSHPDLVYLDGAASTQTPQIVLDAMNEYYTQYRSNIHRGLYDLSSTATEKYEEARGKIAKFIGAEKNEIIFTSGTTHGLNFLASSLGKNLKKGDNIVLTQLEHHANLVPWQMIAKEKGVELRFIELSVIASEENQSPDQITLGIASSPSASRNDSEYVVNIESAKKLIDENTKIVSFALVSNALGTITPAKEIIELAKNVGATTVVDGAQAIAHIGVDVKVLDCDFFVFSGHKMYGPTGIGVVYGKKEKLATLEPYFYGGDMIREVTYENSTWADIPERFEGGTPNIAGAIGLAAAVDFIESIGWEKIVEHEKKLTQLLLDQLCHPEERSDEGSYRGVKIIGPSNLEKRVGVISFILEGVHPHDVAEILNRDHIAVRVGHHCCMPLMKLLGLSGTVRISIGVYTTEQDIEKFIEGVKKVKNIFL